MYGRWRDERESERIQSLLPKGGATGLNEGIGRLWPEYQYLQLKVIHGLTGLMNNLKGFQTEDKKIYKVQFAF